MALFTLQTVTEAAVAIPFANVVVYDATLTRVLELATDSAGAGEAELDAGSYSFVATKYGFRFLASDTTLLAPGVAPDVSLVGVAITADTWLTVADLELVVARDVVDRLFQDTNSSARDPVLVQGVILEAVALAESKLLRNWSREQIAQLAFHDAAIRMNAAWLALELACERRGEFIAADGKGRYWVQYERAIAFFDALSKSKEHSRGEKAATQLGVSAAGTGANTGGKRMPRPQQGQNFVFADEGDGTKHGGF